MLSIRNIMEKITADPSRQASMAELDEIFVELFKLAPSSIDEAMTARDVDLWDSLRHMELIVAIEQKFGLELTFDEIATMQSIGAIRRLVASKMRS